MKAPSGCNGLSAGFWLHTGLHLVPMGNCCINYPRRIIAEHIPFLPVQFQGKLDLTLIVLSIAC